MDSMLAYVPAYLLVLLLMLFCASFLLVRTWRRLF